MTVKRLMDLFISAAALIGLSLFLLVVAVLVKVDSPGPAFYRQVRVGRFGRPFRIAKFRTMTWSPASDGPKITKSGDRRITRLGGFLRRHKIDELPQLWNVLRGEMSFVGPRPEVAEYVSHYSQRQKEKILSLRPGITDLASIEFVDENELLKDCADVDHAYMTKILPRKLELCERYVDAQSLSLDLRIICGTLKTLIVRSSELSPK